MQWNLIKNVNVWCFSTCILEVDMVDEVFHQTRPGKPGRMVTIGGSSSISTIGAMGSHGSLTGDRTNCLSYCVHIIVHFLKYKTNK